MPAKLAAIEIAVFLAAALEAAEGRRCSLFSAAHDEGRGGADTLSSCSATSAYCQLAISMGVAGSARLAARLRRETAPPVKAKAGNRRALCPLAPRHRWHKRRPAPNRRAGA